MRHSNFKIFDRENQVFHKFKIKKFTGVNDDDNLLNKYKITQQTIIDKVESITEALFNEIATSDGQKFMYTMLFHNILNDGTIVLINEMKSDQQSMIIGVIEIRLIKNVKANKWYIDLLENDISLAIERR